MRRANMYVSIAVIVLLVIHGVAGGYQMAGIIPGGTTWMEVLSWIMIALICLHCLIGIILTVQTIAACKKSETSYYKENKIFWTRRISGLAVIVLIFYHVIVFIGSGDGVYRLHNFGGVQLFWSLVLVAALILHVITNIKPLMIGLGMRKGRRFGKDILFILAVVLLFTAAMFVVYYLRWNVLWR